VAEECVEITVAIIPNIKSRSFFISDLASR